MMEPENLQEKESESCHWIACLTVRQLYQKVFPEVFKEDEIDDEQLRMRCGYPPSGPIPAGSVLNNLDALFGPDNYDRGYLDEAEMNFFSTIVQQRPALLPHVFSPCLSSAPTHTDVVLRQDYIRSCLCMTGWATTCPEKRERIHAMAVIGTAHASGEDYFVCRHSWPGWKLALIPCMSSRELKQAGVTDDVLALHSIIIPRAFGGTGIALPNRPLVASAGAVIPSWKRPFVAFP